MSKTCDTLYECKEDSSQPERVQLSKCSDSSECIAKEMGKYSCECKKDYVKNGDKCEPGKNYLRK